MNDRYDREDERHQQRGYLPYTVGIEIEVLFHRFMVYFHKIREHRRPAHERVRDDKETGRTAFKMPRKRRRRRF